MKWTRIGRVLTTVCLTNMLAGAAGVARGQVKLSEKEATEVGADVYIYGYPLVTLEMTRRLTANTAEPAGMRAPMGQFAHARTFPPITYRDVPAANADTLYSLAWVDLAKEPYVLSIPDAQGRYYMIPMLDGWSEVFQVPGTRTTGGKAQTYGITGPGWKGKLPAGATEYKSDTDLVWIIGRTYTTGTPDDYQKVHEFQDKLSLVPMSAYGKQYTPTPGKVDTSVDMKTPTKEQVVNMDAAAYFKLLATLLKGNPPRADDRAMVAEMAKIGLVAGKDWDMGSIDSTTAAGLAQAPKAGVAKIMAHASKAGKVVNGWVITRPAGQYGTNYLQRALLNWQGPGWNRVEDSVYPLTSMDGDGKPLNGARQYVIHFGKGELPPVRGFWSLTLYDNEGFFVANALDRINLSQANPLRFNGDESLDLYIQSESPGKDKEANWLPCPKGNFLLFMRLYWPSEKPPSILDGSWVPPKVRAAR